MTMTNTNPSTYIGGTWVEINDVFLLAAGTSHPAGETGGSEEVTLTVDQMPAHKHYTINMAHSEAGVSPDWQHTVARYDRANTSWSDCHYQLNGISNEANAGRSSTTGGGAAHPNMPPYLAVYMWKRTA
jgi:microcystin-dependent protein